MLVVSDNCGHCASLKSELQQKGLLDKIKVIRFETEQGREFCRRNNIHAVPECMVVIGPNGEKARTCNPQEFQKLIEEGC